MQRWLDRYILQSNLWISTCAAAWSAAMMQLLGFFSYELLTLVFGATLFTYNYQRWVKLKQGLYSGHVLVLGNARVRLVAMALGFVLSAVAAWLLRKELWPWYVPMSILGLFYVTPVGKPNAWALRQVPGIKLVLISLAWALIIAVLPGYLAGIGISELLFIAGSCFFFIMAITIPFDIRDAALDSARLNTLPQRFGTKSAIRVALICSVVSVLSGVGHAQINGSYELLWAALIANGFAAPLIFRTNASRRRWHYSLWLDGMIMVWALAQLVLLYI